MGVQQSTAKDTGGKLDARTDETDALEPFGSVSFRNCDVDGYEWYAADSFV